jgi:nicotinate-nucleotide adenylyltransferase
MKKERIGIFGGTFNPIHLGHVRAALAVQTKFSLDKVLLIPSHIPPHKGSPDIVSPFHRLQMVELAAKLYPLFLASSIEIDAKGKSYSVHTLSKLKKQFPESAIFFILGIDAFLEIDTWREYKKLLDQCHFIVISRPGYNIEDAKNILGGLYIDRIIQDFEPVIIEEAIAQKHKIFLLPIPALDIASKEIRRKVKSGESIAGLVTEPVREYIELHNLYR